MHLPVGFLFSEGESFDRSAPGPNFRPSHRLRLRGRHLWGPSWAAGDPEARAPVRARHGGKHQAEGG